ncbi:MAG: ribokinase [Ktedonobacteraceae bacterium]|nr:ribokinase [Ktedonobacteraceae bacterium]
MLSGKKPVVVVGSINIDLVSNTDRIPVAGETILARDFQTHPGGKGANQAVAVGRLGYPVRMIGRVGNDAFGTQLKASLESASVDIEGVVTSEGSSGVAIIVVAQHGVNSIVITPGANALVTPQDLEKNLEIIRSAGIVLTQLEIPTETVEYLAKICSRVNVPLILDPAPAKVLTPSLFHHVQWFTPNETETAFYTGHVNGNTDDGDPGTMAMMLLSKGVKGVVLKRGERGAYMASVAGLRAFLNSFPVKAIDSTGAGDAFNGAFATGLMLGMTPLESARFAAAAAAISVTRVGAQPSMPVMAEVEQLLNRTPHANESFNIRAMTTYISSEE